MPEIGRLSGVTDWIDLDFVERERTPVFAMKLGIQMHVAGLSLSNTIPILERLTEIFLRELRQKHDVEDAVFLVDAGGYLTTLSRHDLSGHLDYHNQNHIENGSRLSLCESTASTRSDGTVNQARNAG